MLQIGGAGFVAALKGKLLLIGGAGSAASRFGGELLQIGRAGFVATRRGKSLLIGGAGFVAFLWDRSLHGGEGDLCLALQRFDS
ncbi:hypothetical protein A7J71_22955 [Achromobacter insolitus]|nr:hypothetical protein A7J71_22955 [Achromobacter insolitus]OCZ51669.1 hypothetical protein A7P22_13890 [Achromobacter insolitus]